LTQPKHVDLAFRIPSPLELVSLPAACFDFPLGSENAATSYNAQRFTENHHLGEDLNGIGGENSDLGDLYLCDCRWACLARPRRRARLEQRRDRVARLCRNGERKYVQSYYGHIEKMLAQAGEDVRRGQKIATVGTANVFYFAHLHFEMREFLTPFIGPGYRDDTRGWLDPTAFINQHRGATLDDVGRMPVW